MVQRLSYQDIARRIVYKNIMKNFEKANLLPTQSAPTMLTMEIVPDVNFTMDDVYVVWFCKTLQNWKALISTTLPDGMYYEVTYSGNDRFVFLDSYKKFNNQSFPLSDFAESHDN